MKFVTVLRKCHEADEYAIAHLRMAILIREKEIVFRVHRKPLVRQLSAVLAMLLHDQMRTCLSQRSRIREKSNREVTIRQLAYLSRGLQSSDAIYLEILIHRCEVTKNPNRCKGRQPISLWVQLRFSVIFPALWYHCTSLFKISGACQQERLEQVVFSFSDA